MKNKTLDIIAKIIDEYPEENFVKADGFDKAIIGIEIVTFRLVYSLSKCIAILMKDYKMGYEEAIEYFDYNVSGKYVGEQTPIWVNDNF